MITGFKTKFNKAPQRPTITKEQAVEILKIARDVVTTDEYLHSPDKEREDYKYVLALRKYYSEPEKQDYLKGLKWSLMKYKEDEQIKALKEELKDK
jgi:hypothetical protein